MGHVKFQILHQTCSQDRRMQNSTSTAPHGGGGLYLADTITTMDAAQTYCTCQPPRHISTGLSTMCRKSGAARHMSHTSVHSGWGLIKVLSVELLRGPTQQRDDL
ncbi:hypothetical protein ABZX51_010716 [Aspergillus tubingensis]